MALKSILFMLVGLGVGIVVGRWSAEPAAPRTPDIIPVVQAPVSMPTAPTPPASPPAPVAGEALNTDAEHRAKQLAHLAALKQRTVDEFVNSAAESREVDYDGVFSRVGLSQEAAARCKSNLTELHRKAIAAGSPLLELLQARHEYDAFLRRELSPEMYRQYREFEAGRGPVLEARQISEFAKANGTPVRVEEEQAVGDLLKSIGLVTTETWHGPYDVIPKPLVGSEAISEEAQSKIAAVKAKMPALKASMEEAHLSDEMKTVATRYFEEYLRQKEQEISALSVSPEERRRGLEQQVQHDLELIKARRP